MTESGTATTLVSAIVVGTLPFITIVLAINQLVISQELDWPGELTDRFDEIEMATHRRQVESLTDTAVSPAAPADFLKLVFDMVVELAEPLAESADDTPDPGLARTLEGFADAVVTEGRLVSTSLEDADFGTFDALASVLGFNGAHLYAARWIKAHYGEDLRSNDVSNLDELIELLAHLAVSRQTIKTLHMQHELAHLLKVLLVVGFPALLGGGIFMMAYDPLIGATASQTGLVLLVSFVVTVVFHPITILLVYTFRIASIAERTADFGPTVPRVEFEEDQGKLPRE